MVDTRAMVTVSIMETLDVETTDSTTKMIEGIVTKVNLTKETLQI